ncbi:MAG: hypothetical protein NC218_08290 [Acetobacter sp.]|nr:hypothetical protein [Acetobacter sp.]
MSIGLVITLVSINMGVLIFLLIDWFKKNYTIVDLETWNTIATFYNEEHDEENNCGGGVGFFRECIYDEEEELEEEDE